MVTDSVGSGAASNLSSPGVVQQQQRMSLIESVSADMSAVSISHSGLSTFLFTKQQLPESKALCFLHRCKNRTGSVSWPEVVKGVPNQGLDSVVLAGAGFGVSFVVFRVYVVFCLVVSTSVINCLERFVSEMTCYCVKWDVKPTHSFTCWRESLEFVHISYTA